MERECFEDNDVASILNEHFVSIKVDREERPDLDSIYMEAVQLLTGTGGWPLTCIALPNGKPIFGGTYINKPKLIARLNELVEIKDSDYGRLSKFADRISSGVNQKLYSSDSTTETDLAPQVEDWKKIWDRRFGQILGAPKFPIPTNLNFILNYGLLCSDEESIEHLKLTLDSMSLGGIYDQIGGGFYRYSVDERWEIPHFEKMLYDNGQLIDIYSKAYKHFKNPRYKHIVYKTVDFLERELLSETGCLYSALDADSEGEEGKFYSFTEADLDQIILPEEKEFFLQIFDLKTSYFTQKKEYEILAEELTLSIDDLRTKVNQISEKILNHRNERKRPGLDDKILTSWNSLTISGLCSAYATFSEKKFLSLAKKNLDYILINCVDERGVLMRVFHEKYGHYIDGFLDDYAYTINACLKMYDCTLKQLYLNEARALTFTSLDLFFDREINGFWFTPNNSLNLYARKQEKVDSVMPSASSVMATNLLALGRHFERTDWISMANSMISSALGNSTHFSDTTNWANAHLQSTLPHYQFSITGTDPSKLTSAHRELLSKKPPHSSLVGPDHPLAHPTPNALQILVCTNGACLLPSTSVQQSLDQIR